VLRARLEVSGAEEALQRRADRGEAERGGEASGARLTIPQSCKRLGVSEQTFYRWRIKYGALKENEAQRLKALEQENSRLKKIVAEQAQLPHRRDRGRAGRAAARGNGRIPGRGVGVSARALAPPAS
jgi:transposase-like protein